ncbi:MAG: TonB-dependent receptor domain-containing protein, partial [Bryobacteraceae bacterium]
RLDGFWDAGLDPTAKETILGGRRIPSIRAPGFDDGGGAEIVSYFGPVWSIEQKYARHAGKHSFKFGGIYSSRGPGRFNIENPRLRYESKADLLANIPSRVQFFFGVNDFHSDSYELGFFGQDDWRVTPKLVINLGIRYDFFSKLVARPRDPRAPAGLFNLDGLRDRNFNYGPVRDPLDPFNSDGWANLGPRVGLSYNVDGKGDTVIRAGLSIMFAPQPWDDYVNSVGTSATSPIRAVFSKIEAGQRRLRFPVFNDDIRPVLEAENKVQITEVFEPAAQNPYSMNLYLGVQRAITSSTMIESAFVGNRGVKFRLMRASNLVDRVTGIRPNPNFGEGRYYNNIQNTVYYSWQSSLRKRYSRNLTGNVHYTWGKALSYAGGDTGAGFSGDSNNSVQDFFDIRANRGPSAGDITHNLIADYVYDLPGLRNLSAVPRHALGGWQLSGIFHTASGQPLIVTQPSSYAASRPDYIGGDPIAPNSRATLQYLNRPAFLRLPIIAASGATPRPGNIGQGAIRLPRRWNLNFSLGKNFAIGERWRLQMRGDMFNFFNHTNFSSVTTDITSGNFGRYSGTTGARVVQLNARLSW